MIVLPQNERTPQPWKNGGGTTVQIATHPPGAGTDDFLWRLSIATIERSLVSPFSSFPRIDRILIPLSTDGLVLRDAAGRHQLARFEPFAFAGEAAIEAVDVARRSLDLNLMTRRGRVDGSLSVVRIDDAQSHRAPAGGSSLLVVLDGAVVADDGTRLDPFDAVLLGEDQDPVEFRGFAIAAVASVTVRHGCS